MLHKLFTVFDRKTGLHSPPMCFFTDGAAIRMFSDEVNSGQSPIAKHPEDYDLYSLCDWDDNTALFASPAGTYPQMLVAGLSVKQ